MMEGVNALKRHHLHQVTATRGDKHLNQTLAELWRFKDNRCVEVWAYFSDQQAWDAFWR